MAFRGGGWATILGIYQASTSEVPILSKNEYLNTTRRGETEVGHLRIDFHRFCHGNPHIPAHHPLTTGQNSIRGFTSKCFIYKTCHYIEDYGSYLPLFLDQWFSNCVPRNPKVMQTSHKFDLKSENKHVKWILK